jgi:hypothetical protein
MPLPPSRTPPYRAHSCHGLRLPLSFRTQRFLDPLAHAHPARAAIPLLVCLWYCMGAACVVSGTIGSAVGCCPVAFAFGCFGRCSLQSHRITSCTQHTPHANHTHHLHLHATRTLHAVHLTHTALTTHLPDITPPTPRTSHTHHIHTTPHPFTTHHIHHAPHPPH